MRALLICVAAFVLPANLVQSQGLIENCVDSFNRQHRINDSYIGPDGCNTCRCMANGNACTRKFCQPKTKMTSEANKCVDNNGNLHEVGESYTHVDGCNTCACKAFGGVCTKKFCLQATKDIKSFCIDSSGQGHTEGDTWQDECNTCRCGALGPICTQRFCLKPEATNPQKDDSAINLEIADETGDSPCTVDGQTKFPGDTWMTKDNCNICTCTGVDGKVDCTEESCRARFLRLVDPRELGEGNSANLNEVSVISTVAALLIAAFV